MAPNDPHRERILRGSNLNDTDYVAPTPDPAQYIEPVENDSDDEGADYNYAYDHEIDTLARLANTDNNSRMPNSSASTDLDYVIPNLGNSNDSAEITYY